MIDRSLNTDSEIQHSDSILHSDEIRIKRCPLSVWQRALFCISVYYFSSLTVYLILLRRQRNFQETRMNWQMRLMATNRI